MARLKHAAAKRYRGVADGLVCSRLAASYCVGPMKCWQLSQERGLVRQLRWWSLSSDAAKVYTPRGYAVGLYILNAEHSSEL